MAQRWFYTCGGLVFGPISSAEMRDVVAKGILGTADLVWPEEGGPAEAMAPAAATGSDRPAPGPAPDWLSDVQAAADTERPPPRPAPAAVPDWLDDLRQAQEAAAPAGPESGGLPDWLADVAAPPAGEPPAAAEEQGSPAAPPEEIPLARRVSPPAETSPDASTDQTLQEAFESARVTLRRCVDDDANRPLIVAGNLKAIAELPIIRQLFNRVQRYGPNLAARLRQHLAFLVDNRRKFYTAG